MAEEPNANGEEMSSVHTRGYQQEMLLESLRNNLVIALDTGAGKTHIAVLRMKHEAEREKRKISWFLAPTVALVEQQKEVIESAIPVPVGIISGEAEPDQWTKRTLWQKLLQDHRIMVSTPQPLFDALTHGYIDLGKDIGLLVFDEAHHAVRKHPYNMIMKQFYFSLPPRRPDSNSDARVRPMVLGLTASPIYGGNVDKSFFDLETNLDAVIRSSRLNREELAQHVHRPIFSHILYAPPPYELDELPSHNVFALDAVVGSMNIEDDPYVITLRARLAKLSLGPDRQNVDQKLSKAVHKGDTFSHRGMRDFLRTAQDIGMELGAWAADWYVAKVVEVARIAANPHNNFMSAWQEKEKSYLLKHLNRINLVDVSFNPEHIRPCLSPKVLALVKCLLQEEESFRSLEERYSGLVFVTRRDGVLTLAEILSRLPEIAERFQIGRLLGNSESSKRHAFLDITRHILKESQADTLRDFRSGDKNLIVSTSVAEEGIDIQACGSVIRFDPPPNVVAWAQSRGRARRQRSSFIMMFQDGGGHQAVVRQWEDTELRMQALYTADRQSGVGYHTEDDDDDDYPVSYTVESTGAVLTLHSATSHLNHFCAVLPNAGYGGHDAIYDLDPPDYPEGWHLNRTSLPDYQGPWGATVTLPRSIDKSLRVFKTERIYQSKRSAQRHAAFKTYVALHKAGLLNDHLLPLTSAIEADKGEEVKKLLEDIEKRAGMQNVPIQMDPWATPAGEERWFQNRLCIPGLPVLHFLTRAKMPTFNAHEFPQLYVPGSKVLNVSLLPLGSASIRNKDYIEKARRYTRRIFSNLYGNRMDPANLSFAYLFIPEAEPDGEQVWRERRSWQQDRVNLAMTESCEDLEHANAGRLGQHFSYPDDLTVIRPNDKSSKLLHFIKWVHESITEEEEEDLRERYVAFPDMTITYPLLLVQPFPRRTNFLHPLTSETQGLPRDKPMLLHPKLATVDLVSSDEIQLAMLLPSVLRWLSTALTVTSLRAEFLASAAVRLAPLPLLRTAITAPVAQEAGATGATNYERLETLGDTVLKFMASIQVFADHPLWHQGYLSRRKDHVVNNQSLAKAAIAKGLFKWIIRDRFVPKKWKPRYVNETPTASPTAEELPAASSSGTGKKPRIQELSTKMLADVVEALIGAAYEHGGFDAAVNCAATFGLDLNWKVIPVRVQEILSKAEEFEDPPAQLGLVERMLAYQFSRKAYLVQALTHGSYHGELATMSYERLEFLGDSALDMVVTDYTYHAPGKNYTPGHMHLRKEAVVNAHFLAFICLSTSLDIDSSMPRWTREEGLASTTETQRIYLYQCLLHSSHRVLEDQRVTFARFEKAFANIDKAFKREAIYPWAALTSMQAPKFISDMVESLLGAVYLDSKGNLDAVKHVMRKLGIMQILERIVDSEMDVLHPVSRLQEWADKRTPKAKITYDVTKPKGTTKITCIIMVNKEKIAEVTDEYRSRVSQEQVKFSAAELAIKRLRVRASESDTAEDEMDAEEDGTPEDGRARL